MFRFCFVFFDVSFSLTIQGVDTDNTIINIITASKNYSETTTTTNGTGSSVGEFEYSFQIEDTVTFKDLSITSSIDNTNNGASLSNLFGVRSDGELRFINCDLASIGNMDNIIAISEGGLLLELSQ